MWYGPAQKLGYLFCCVPAIIHACAAKGLMCVLLDLQLIKGITTRLESTVTVIPLGLSQEQCGIRRAIANLGQSPANILVTAATATSALAAAVLQGE